jgi:hypothetical protein
MNQNLLTAKDIEEGPLSSKEKPAFTLRRRQTFVYP